MPGTLLSSGNEKKTAIISFLVIHSNGRNREVHKLSEEFNMEL